MREWVVVVLVASACTTSTAEPVELELAPQLATPMDVLVVIDDTGLAQTANIPDPRNLAGVLKGIYNGAPDFQIAFTTSTTGALRTSQAVPTGVIQHHVRMEDGVLETNYPGELADAIHSLTSLTSSTAPNTLLASTVSALGGSDFVRPDAALGILLVSSHDDASPDAPEAYAAAIESHATRSMVSAVYQQPAERIGQFLVGMTDRYEQPIGQYNMEAISSLAGMFEPLSGASCFPLAVTQASDCELATAYHHVSIPLPECSTSAPSTDDSPPCFELVADASCGSGLTIVYGGPYRYYHPTVIGRCNL
jgi:hypothetical protein